MRLCVETLLKENPGWMGRYMLGSYILLGYCALAFLVLEGNVGFFAQAAFFLIAFPWILWPIFAALCPSKRR